MSELVSKASGEQSKQGMGRPQVTCTPAREERKAGAFFPFPSSRLSCHRLQQEPPLASLPCFKPVLYIQIT
jgi:hypothetical protein